MCLCVRRRIAFGLSPERNNAWRYLYIMTTRFFSPAWTTLHNLDGGEPVNDVDSGRATILVVDDYAELRSLLRLWLEARGYRVAEAADGREAVEVAERERPALILMDVAMPGVDGFSAALRIRRMGGLGGVPIVATSAYGDSAKAVQLKIDPTAVGFNAYLPKPFGPQQLDELLELFAPRRVVLAAGP